MQTIDQLIRCTTCYCNTKVGRNTSMNVPWSWKLRFYFVEPFAFCGGCLSINVAWECMGAWLDVCGMLYRETQLTAETEWAWRPSDNDELWMMELPLWAESVWSWNGVGRFWRSFRGKPTEVWWRKERSGG
jgi:hypothetical protein